MSKGIGGIYDASRAAYAVALLMRSRCLRGRAAYGVALLTGSRCLRGRAAYGVALLMRSRCLRGEHNLRVATIFTYSANEEDADYNAMNLTQYSVKDSTALFIYYKDIAQETQLRSKRELIERFIDEYMPNFEAGTVVEEEFVKC